MIDVNHPFFEKRWRRWGVVIFCFGWGSAEFFFGNNIWGIAASSIGAYAAWVLLIQNKQPDQD